MPPLGLEVKSLKNGISHHWISESRACTTKPISKAISDTETLGLRIDIEISTNILKKVGENLSLSTNVHFQ